MKYTILTLFPALVRPFACEALIGRAVKNGLISIEVRDIRDSSMLSHRKVDDTPYGGGAGMVVRADVMAEALTELDDAHIVMLSPAGQPLTQRLAEELAGEQHLALVCGRYEGFDARVEAMVDREVSIGDFVMMGGEAAAACVLEATARLIPGVLHDQDSHRADSFSSGLLDYPEYTRPDVLTWRGQTLRVPGVLQSGNHAVVARWRRREALRRTLSRRPDLLQSTGLDGDDICDLESLGAMASDLERLGLDAPKSHPRKRGARMTLRLSPEALTWTDLKPRFEELARRPLALASVSRFLDDWSRLEKLAAEAHALTVRQRDENTADETARARVDDMIQVFEPALRAASQTLRARLLTLPNWQPHDDEMQLVRRFRDASDLYRDQNQPLLSSLDELGSEYTRIVGAQSVQIGGETLPMARAAKRLISDDRSERETAWRTIAERRMQDAPRLHEVYLELLKLRRAVAENAGFTTFTDYAFREYHRDYTPADCFAFHQAIEATVTPSLEPIFEERRELMGLPALRPWDDDWRAAPDARRRPPQQPFSTGDELEEGVSRMLHALDPELGGLFASLRQYGDLDLNARANKAPGGYHARLPHSRRSYIFMSAAGTQENVTTLLHEAGHAFHFLLSSREQPLSWNASGPIEFNEVASMSMELLAAPFLESERGGFYAPPDAARARADHLEHILRFFPYMAAVDAFQHWVHAQDPYALKAADLDDAWEREFRRFMGPVNWTGLEQHLRIGWQRQLHLFLIPFYYVEYGLAQLGALQIWRTASANPTRALRQYKAALALGNTRPTDQLFAAAGARLMFDAQSIAPLVTLVRKERERQLGLSE